LVWTWEWTHPDFGHAHSADLVNWGEHRRTEALPGVQGVKNVWAPELVQDPQSKEWIVFWSSTIEGKFPETAQTLENGKNHRIYARSTGDFSAFSAPWVFFDPGYPVIDASIMPVPGGFEMFFKDERLKPLRKRILRASSKSVRGPWQVHGDAFTEEWSEGPSAIRVGKDTIVYYDHYRDVTGFRAMRSRDLVHWENITHLLGFPPKSKHGSFLRITDEEARRLETAKP
jgi:beta-xylosidase